MIEKVYKEGRQSMQDLNYFLTELKEQNPWLYQHHSKMLQMVSTQIAGAQKALAQKRKNGYNAGQLRFALYNKYNTFVYNQSGFKIEDGFLHLSKIGKIKIIQHRTIPEYCAVKQVTVSRQAGKWFACVAYDTDDIMVLPWHQCDVQPESKKAIGIDVGITNFAYDSDGIVTPNPLNLKKMLKPLRRIQRKVSRRQKGSQNRKKAIRFYQRIHQRIANKRKDFCHKTSTAYAKKHCTIFAEKLQMPNMVQNHKLSRNILDSGWGMFKEYLKYKTELVEVPPNNTSMNCSRCGTKVPKSLCIRTHRCHLCGLVLDRDHNAAINILQKGINSKIKNNHDVLPQELWEFTPVEISKMSVKQERTSTVASW